MCGRYTLRSVDRIRIELAANPLELDDILPRFNIAPGQTVFANVGGYFCWYFNEDVIDKITASHDDSVPKKSVMLGSRGRTDAGGIRARISSMAPVKPITFAHQTARRNS